jgi:hypothetical protein
MMAHLGEGCALDIRRVLWLGCGLSSRVSCVEGVALGVAMLGSGRTFKRWSLKGGG